MSGPRQRTISGSVHLEGVGVHSGEAARIEFRAGEPGTGVRFRRIDLPNEPEVPARLERVVSTDHGTTIGAGEVTVRTVEHAMAAMAALQLDNVLVEIDGPEVPIRDGSFQDFLSALESAGPVEQDAEARVLRLGRPVSTTGDRGQSYVAAPSQGLRVSGAIEFEHPLVGRQYASFGVDLESFRAEIAPARTFGLESAAAELRARGLALGASHQNTVALGEDGSVSGELRFPDEFIRHKVGDLVGDLALIGGRLEAHVVAERPSHCGNVRLARAIEKHVRHAERTPIVDAAKIMRCLPHRYPMLLVDRITDYEEGKRIVGIKNVTINEPFFQGHYPGHPVMPGVLILEAMAQVGGLLLMEHVEDPATKVVYFMTMDNVKWRRPVVPGDTVVFELEVLQLKASTCKMRGEGFVEGQLVAEAEFMARIVDR